MGLFTNLCNIINRLKGKANKYHKEFHIWFIEWSWTVNQIYLYAAFFLLYVIFRVGTVAECFWPFDNYPWGYKPPQTYDVVEVTAKIPSKAEKVIKEGNTYVPAPNDLSTLPPGTKIYFRSIPDRDAIATLPPGTKIWGSATVTHGKLCELSAEFKKHDRLFAIRQQMMANYRTMHPSVNPISANELNHIISVQKHYYEFFMNNSDILNKTYDLQINNDPLDHVTIQKNLVELYLLHRKAVYKMLDPTVLHSDKYSFQDINHPLNIMIEHYKQCAEKIPNIQARWPLVYLISTLRTFTLDMVPLDDVQKANSFAKILDHNASTLIYAKLPLEEQQLEPLYKEFLLQNTQTKVSYHDIVNFETSRKNFTEMLKFYTLHFKYVDKLFSEMASDPEYNTKYTFDWLYTTFINNIKQNIPHSSQGHNVNFTNMLNFYKFLAIKTSDAETKLIMTFLTTTVETLHNVGGFTQEKPTFTWDQQVAIFHDTLYRNLSLYDLSLPQIELTTGVTKSVPTKIETISQNVETKIKPEPTLTPEPLPTEITSTSTLEPVLTEVTSHAVQQNIPIETVSQGVEANIKSDPIPPTEIVPQSTKAIPKEIKESAPSEIPDMYKWTDDYFETYRAQFSKAKVSERINLTLDYVKKTFPREWYSKEGYSANIAKIEKIVEILRNARLVCIANEDKKNEAAFLHLAAGISSHVHYMGEINQRDMILVEETHKANIAKGYVSLYNIYLRDRSNL